MGEHSRVEPPPFAGLREPPTGWGSKVAKWAGVAACAVLAATGVIKWSPDFFIAAGFTILLSDLGNGVQAIVNELRALRGTTQELARNQEGR